MIRNLLAFSLLLAVPFAGIGVHAKTTPQRNSAVAPGDFACSLTITGTSVGECTYDETSMSSKVLVAVFVDWADAPAGQTIQVNFLGETKTINPAVSGHPKYVQFIVTPDASTSTVTAAFSGGTCTATWVDVTLAPACAPPDCSGRGAIGDRVFFDYNSNGIREVAENGITGVSVKIYDAFDQLVCTTASGINGLWACTNLPENTMVRIEYVVDNSFLDGRMGPGSQTSVQFGTTGTCNNDLGIYKVADFMDNDPWLITPCYGKGDPFIAGSQVGDDPTLVANKFSTPYGAGITGPNGNFYVAKASETGAVDDP